MGYLGEVHPLVADAYGIGEKTYIAVIDILDILKYAGFDHKYTGIAKYPAVTRDLSMVVPKSVLAGDIEKMLEQRGGKILESYQLFKIPVPFFQFTWFYHPAFLLLFIIA